MAETRGFDVVAEVSEDVLESLLKAAWDNGGTSDPGAIPHEVPIPPGTALGPYVASGGQVSIEKSGLSLVMAPADNGVTISIATHIQVQMDTATTHLQSLSLLDMDATIAITAPFGQIPNSAPNIGILFAGLPRSKVGVQLTSGNPIGPITLELIQEYVHNLYTDGTIPHTQTHQGQSYGSIQFDAHVEIWDDETDPARRIEVSLPVANQLRLSLPIYVRLSNMSGYPGIQSVSPMGVVARLILTVPYTQTDSQITANLPSSAVSVEGLGPAAGTEGSNYTTAKSFFPSLDSLFQAQITSRGQAIVSALAPLVIPLPTVAQIETLIGDKVHQELLARQFVGTWTPTTPEGSPVTITEARPKALATGLAIAINPNSGANENLLTDFIPAGKPFAIALDGTFVSDIIRDVIARPEAEGGLGGIPKHFPDISGHAVDVTSLTWELQNGKIHFSGSCTVHDVFCGADADCDFWADIGLKWSAPDANGTQTLIPFLIDSDASLPWWAWLLAVLGFLFGVIIGVIMVVITVVIEDIAERIGAAVMADQVNNKLQILGAWPQNLQGVGTITSTFDEAVTIEPSGLVFTGSMIATAKFALVAVSPAKAHGPYSAQVAASIQLQAGAALPSLQHLWNLGDGASGTGNLLSHTYAETGRYVARLAANMNVLGGALTHESAVVRVRNVRPTVDAGPDISVKEGESFSVTGHFSNPEWVDGHEAIWSFGDDTLPQAGAITQTNEAPAALGTVTGHHAYCNNGVYTVTLRVRDEDGGIGEDTRTVYVENVAPRVTTGGMIFAYPCVPVTLVANFVDPGWCDTHTASWRFGDGDFALEPTPATVREVHEPPMGYGLAAATHTYHALATHEAECVVIDSDGARGRATLRVVVVDLMNKDFEAGFHMTTHGAVANEWEPYSCKGRKEPGPAPAPGVTYTPKVVRAQGSSDALFDAEELIVRDGQRAQRMRIVPGQCVGIRQRVGANAGWDYQVTAHYHIEGGGAGLCRVGIDSTGGNDPDAPEIVWAEGDASGNWHKLLVRATAKGKQVTVFLEGEGVKGSSVCWFDAVAFEPFPCRLHGPQKPELEETDRAQCVDFKDERESRSLKSPHERSGFVFESHKQDPLTIVLWGTGDVTGKLAIGAPYGGSLFVTLPFVADSVRAEVFVGDGAVRMTALDAGGTSVADVTAQRGPTEVVTMSLTHEGITRLSLSGKGRIALVQLCASAKTMHAANPREPDELDPAHGTPRLVDVADKLAKH